MGPVLRRALLYGTALPVLSALIYGGFVYRTSADIGTLLGSVDVQLRLAASMPAKDAAGRAVPAREELLEAAADHLHAARALDPGSPIVAEYEGFLAGQRGDPRAAAAHYRRARSMPACGSDQRDVLWFNEARMLGAAGDHAAALAVYREQFALIQPGYRTQCRIEMAGELHQLGQDDAAVGELQQAIASDEPMAWLQAGCLYQVMGRTGEAEAALTKAAAAVPVADYHLARLKLAAGDVDSCLRLLERAHQGAPAEVGRLLLTDAAAWQAVAADARYQAITAPKATPGR